MNSHADVALPEALTGLFRRARRRLRAVWFAATSSVFAPWVATAALLVAAIGWVRPWGWPEPVAITVVVVSLLAAVVGSALLRLPSPVVARALDRSLETDDALVSALQFAPTDAFGPRVHARAARYADTDVRTALPAPWRPKPLAVATLILAALVAALVLRNPQDSVREQLAADREALAALADEFEERAGELEDELGATAESDALAEELRALAESLREAEDLDSGIAALTETQEDLLRSIDAQDLAERAASQGLDRTLAANPLAAGANAAEQLMALSAAMESLSAEEQAALADRLEQLAATQEAGDEATADALTAAAAALAQGNSAAASAALAQASTAAAEAAASAAASAQAATSAATAGQAAQELRERAEGQGQGEGEGQGGGEGQGQGAGQGEGEGEDQGEGQGQGQGEGQGAGGQGMNATGNNPSGQGTAGAVDGSGNQGEGPAAPPSDTPVLVPDGETDTASADVDATGDGIAETDQRVTGNTGAGTAQVPLGSIANEFASRATDALDGTNISSAEATNVANYFDVLTQGSGS